MDSEILQNAILDYIRRHASAPHCFACLGKVFAHTAEATEALLRSTPGWDRAFLCMASRCGACGEQATVIFARSVEDILEDEEQDRLFVDIEMQARHFYDETWADWFGKLHDAPRATLFVREESGMCVYRPDANEIHLFIPKGHLRDADVDGSDHWPLWKRELVHEMLHEWEHKALHGAASPAGEELWRMHPYRFQSDHQAAFLARSSKRLPTFR